MNFAIVNPAPLNPDSPRVSLSPRSRRLLRRLTLVLLLALPCIALATPPASAPANGLRGKNAVTYEGYSGRHWNDDYGVRSGSCNREGIGVVLGGIAGGTVGAQATRGEEQAAAIVVGAVVGAAIGAEIGRHMDRTDRSCAGHALELASPGESVSWTNPDTQVTYLLTPLRKQPRVDGCRKFLLIAHGSFGLSEGRTVACPDPRGVWSLAPDGRMSQR